MDRELPGTSHGGVHSHVLGAVLAGGRSSRFGSDKALYRVDGLPMAARVAAALRGGGAGAVIAVGGDAAALGAAGVTVVPDHWPGDGPVGALVTAVEHARRTLSAAIVIVAPCDLAMLDAASVRAVVDAVRCGGPAGPAVAVAVDADTGRRQPLLSAWSVEATGSVVHSAFVAGCRSAHGALDAVTGAGPAVVEVALPAGALRNVNQPGDLDR